MHACKLNGSINHSVNRTLSRHGKPDPETHVVHIDVAHTAADDPDSVKLSREQKLGHHQRTSFQNVLCDV